MTKAKAIAVTGADGFIGRNLRVRLEERGDRVLCLTRTSGPDEWARAIAQADAVVHLAGANRPVDTAEFEAVNIGTARQVVDAIAATGRKIPLLYSSTVKVADSTAYGVSKKAAEDALLALSQSSNPVYISRLPKVFGKWARPNYNSAVATFCHNVARGLPITLHDRDAPLALVYVDDVVEAFLSAIDGNRAPGFVDVAPVYETTVGSVADTIQGFRQDRENNLIACVGEGLIRALYATYVSTLPAEEFAYPIASHRDPRGAFSEMLKTRTSGQFSYFNALPGVTRGGHYHHTKTEKFLIVHGEALFRFRHILTGEVHEIRTFAEAPTVVETIPGWAHDVTNVGDGIMVSLLWANEIFDREHPDTIPAKV